MCTKYTDQFYMLGRLKLYQRKQSSWNKNYRGSLQQCPRTLSEVGRLSVVKLSAVNDQVGPIDMTLEHMRSNWRKPIRHLPTGFNHQV